MRAPTFILDGSNLAWLGPGEGAALAPIDAIADTLRAEWPGCKVIVVCDASLRHRLDERDRAEHGRRAKAGALVEAPADEDADAYILAAAKQLEACVVTRDLYRDRRAERAGVPMLRPALIGGAVVLGEPKVFASAGDERSTSVDPAALGARVAPGPLPGGAPVSVRGGAGDDEDEDDADDEDGRAPRATARGRRAMDDDDEVSAPRPAAPGRRAAVDEDEGDGERAPRPARGRRAVGAVDDDAGDEDDEDDEDEAPRAPPRPVIRVEVASDPPEEEEFTPHPAAKVTGGKASGGKASGSKASDGKAAKGSGGASDDSAGKASDGSAGKASRGKASDGRAGKASDGKASDGKASGGKASGGKASAGRVAKAPPSPAPPGQTALGAVILLALLAGVGALVWWLVGGDPAPTPPRDPGVVFVRGCRAWVRAGGEERIAVYVRPGECVTSARALGPERFAATIEGGSGARVVLVKGDTRTHDFAVAGAPALLAVDARHLLVGGDGEATLYTYSGEAVHRAPLVGAASAEAVAVVLWHGCEAGCGRWRRARGDDALREAVESVAADDDAGAPPPGRRFVGPVAIAPDGERFAALVDEGEGAAVLVFGPERGDVERRPLPGRWARGVDGLAWVEAGLFVTGGEALLAAGGDGEWRQVASKARRVSGGR